MAGAGKTRSKGMAGSRALSEARKKRDSSVAGITPAKRSGSLAEARGKRLATMSTGQYVRARASSDIAKVKEAYNSPTGKKVRSAAMGFGSSVAKASKRTIQAGKQARSLYSKLR